MNQSKELLRQEAVQQGHTMVVNNNTVEKLLTVDIIDIQQNYGAW